MQELIPIFFIILLYGSFFGIIVYLIIKRIADKNTEDFEKRDN